MKKMIKIATSLLLISLTCAAGLVIYFVIQAKGDIEKIPSIFGYKPLTILSNSMQPTFNAGDIILINTEVAPNQNDVITYKHPDGVLVTHRVIKETIKDGEKYYSTKGDNNKVEDKLLIPRGDILGVQTFIIPFAGYIAKFASGPLGFILLIIIPLVAFVSIEIFQRLGLIGNKEQETQV